MFVGLTTDGVTSVFWLETGLKNEYAQKIVTTARAANISLVGRDCFMYQITKFLTSSPQRANRFADNNDRTLAACLFALFRPPPETKTTAATANINIPSGQIENRKINPPRTARIKVQPHPVLPPEASCWRSSFSNSTISALSCADLFTACPPNSYKFYYQYVTYLYAASGCSSCQIWPRAWRKASTPCAPEMAYLLSKIKKGTPWMPYWAACEMSACTSVV